MKNSWQKEFNINYFMIALLLAVSFLLASFVFLPQNTSPSAITQDMISTPDGDGSEISPYKITQNSELMWLSYQNNNVSPLQNVFISLQANLDMSGQNWEAIGTDSNTFSGTLLGNGHTISNLTLSGVTYAGLFGVTGMLTIDSLNLAGVNFSATSYAGAFVARASVANLNSCVVESGTISCTSSAGGLVGQGQVYASECSNNASVSGGTYVGGIVGNVGNQGTEQTHIIENNVNYADIQGNGDVAGIVGSIRAAATLTNNVNMGNITVLNNSDTTAGIAGYAVAGTIIDRCFTFGDITGAYYTAGIVGYNSSSLITNCYVSGTIKGSFYTGGLLGYTSNLTIENCGVNAMVMTSNVPNSNGFIGQGSCAMTNCYFIGAFVDHDGNAESMSAFVGYIPSGGIIQINDSYFIANGRKVMQNTNNFEDWTIIPNLNDGNPIQKELYHLAGIGGDDELLDAWVKTNNILTDSSFEYGDWSAWMGTSELSTEHARSGQHSWKIIGESSRWETFNRTVTTYEIDSTHIYFVRMYAYQELQVGEIQAYWKDSDPAVGNATLGTAGQWNMYGWRFDRVGFSGSHPFRIDFDNHNQVGELWVDDVLLVDLTEMYGAGNEPSQEECMRLFA